jgi:hypothetical protein
VVLMFNRRDFSLFDERLFNEKQIEQVRQIARDELAGSIEHVITEIIDKRLAGMPTVQEMTLLFERQQRVIHEFISSTDLYLRRAEKEFVSIGDIKHDLGVMIASINTRNHQLDEAQRDIDSIADRVSRNNERIVGIQENYAALKTSIFGDPSLPEIPSLTAQLHERSMRADQQHEEIKLMLNDEMKPMIERANQRLVEIELFIAKRREVEVMVKNALLFVAKNPKWIAIIAGGGAIGAAVIEFIKAALG